jgi:hypothetical protein
LRNFYSNGKLLLTGEYLVLDGAKSLAIPTKFGQDLVLEKIREPEIIWGSFTHTGECWFEAVFDLKKLRLINCTFHSEKEGNADVIAETLLEILREAKDLNPDFLKSENGFMVKTNLTFPRNWGLWTSSTLPLETCNKKLKCSIICCPFIFPNIGFDFLSIIDSLDLTKFLSKKLIQRIVGSLKESILSTTAECVTVLLSK